MRDVIDHIDACNILQPQKIDCLTFLLTKDGHNHIGTDHFAVVPRIRLEHRTLKHTLETVGGLGLFLKVDIGDKGGC